NAVQPLVSDIDIAMLVQGDGGRPHELAVVFATGAELSDVLLVERDHRDVYSIAAVFIRPVDDIDYIIGGQGQVHGIPEPRPGKLVAAHGVAVGKRPVLDAKEMRTHSVSFVVIECILPSPMGKGKSEGPHRAR